MNDKLKQHLKVLNESQRKKGGWTCKYCDNTFPTRHLMYEHMHVAHPEKCNKTNAKKIWQCEYCKSIFDTRKSLFEHYKVCIIKQEMPKDSKGRVLSSIKDAKQCYCTFCNREFTSSHGLAYHESLCESNPNRSIPFWKGKKHKYSSRQKTADSFIKNLENKVGNIQYNYNPDACAYMDKLNESRNWHLQHALNGGEIKCGPYSLDGYDKEANIIFEYDEPEHELSKRKEHDIIRQDFLIKTLNPKEFWRYSEKFDRLYRIV